MTLSQTSIRTILAYLDPHLETLQTGFPTSTRPNEPVLTKEQKQQKIEASLTNDPGIFLTKWGSVILYPRPVPSTSAADGHTDGDRPSLGAEHGLTAKDILDLFAPLAVDYEVKFQLTRLYQQLQQLSEHASFEASRIQLSASSTTIHGTTPNNMDVEPPQHPSTLRSKDIAPEDRKPDPGQDDIFARSTVSEKTRRNRRLNYLLRHLAPPDSSQTSSHSSGAKGKGPGIHATSHSSSHGGGSSSNNNGGTLNPQYHPTLASILSISGSLSNLSFAESTYFSDAEMQARAPELYQQYIGRFMDNDDDEEDEEDGDDDDSADEDNVQRRRSRRSKQALEPFGKDVGLVDRILWGVDHENLKQRQQPRHSQDYNGSSMEPTLPPTRQKPSSHQHAHESLFMEHASNKQDDPSDFEEEFDTESEDEDSKMVGNKEKADDGGASPKNVIESKDEIHIDAIVASTASLEPAPQSISSTTASGAMLLDEPEERTRFAAIEHDNSANSDDDKELDQDTANRKEDQEALRQDFVLLMKQRFLDGLDRTFDYSIVDFDENLDDMEQENYDEEDRWFEDEDDGDNDDGTIGEASSGSRGVAHTIRAKAGLTSRMALDERLLAWENNAQNGSGDYDY